MWLRKLTVALLGALLLAALPARAQLPPLTSEADDARQGAAAHGQIVTQFGGVYADPELGAYVAMVGARLLAAAGQQGKEYRFSILDSDVPNAFALPGGYAYVTRGMLALINTEAELAGVMGHEIGHVIARHSAQRQTGSLIAGLLAGAIGMFSKNADVAQIAGMLGQGALAQYSQQQEYEADALGVQYMRAGGWNPLAQGDMLSALQRESDRMSRRPGARAAGNDFFASHPNTLERIGRAVGLARQAGATGDYGREAWLRHVDGLSYGGSAQNGYVRGQLFVHPAARIQFTAPPGWELQNGATQVAARGRDGVLVFDQAKADSRLDVSPSSYVTSFWLDKVPFDGLQTLTIDGLRAAAGTALVPQQGGGTLRIHVCAIEYERNRFYRFQAVADSGADLRPLADSFRSFRRLSPREAAAVRPWRIRIVAVQPGDTIASLSQRMAMPNDRETIFRVINALDPGMELRPGDRVKLVLEDR